uniref:LysR family transcriptional regulator n=1 Tax=Candidatus Fimivicinus sp. TaxID=3056640 RepID=UPI003FED71EA
MRLVQLEYFIKIAECGSITKAAQELYVSQPSLTKAIANLEAEYDIRLLERTPKGVRMTARGSEFLEYARDVINSRQKLEDTFGKKETVPVQRLCVASQQFDFLYDLLEEVCRENQMMVNVMMAEVDRGTVLKRVKGRTADVGILILTDSDRKDFDNEIKKNALEAHKMAHSGVYVCMASLSPFYGRTEVKCSEISDYLHVALDMDEQLIRKMYLGDLEGSVDNEQLICCNTISACLYFMREAGALLYIPKWVKGLLEKEDDIHVIPLMKDDGSPYPMVNHLAWVKREDEELTIPEQRFVHLLHEKVAETDR